MLRTTTFFQQQFPYWILYALVGIASLYVAQGTRLFLNVDSLSYISIAKLYANGEFTKAINGHWSPLLSWLLVPIQWLNLDIAYWGKVLIGLSVIPSLIIVQQINESNRIHPTLNFFIVLTTAAVLFFPAMVNFTPDVLLIAPLLFVIYALLQSDESKIDWKLAAAAGLGYYVKHFMLAYFLTLFVVAIILKLIQTPRANRNALVGRVIRCLIIFALIVLPWVICLSVKYKKPMFSTAASYNTAFLFNPNETARDYRENGLIDLPYPEASSYWDDPALIKLPSFGWKEALQTSGSRTYQLYRINENFKALFDFLNYMLNRVLIYVLVVWLFAIAWIWIKRKSLDLFYSLTLIALLLYCATYVVIVVDQRYLYFALVLVILAAGKMLSDISITFKLSTTVQILAACGFALLFGWMSVNKTIEYYVDGKRKNIALVPLAKNLVPGSKHCNAFTHHVHTDLMFLSDLKYCGKLKENVSLAYTNNELQTHNIRYVTSITALPDSMLTLMKPIAQDVRGIWIYETTFKKN